MSIDPESKAKAAAEAAAFLAGLTASAWGAAAAWTSPEQLPPPGSHSPGGAAGPATAVPGCSRWQSGLSGMLPPSVKAEPLESGHSSGPGPGPLPAEPFTSGGHAAPQQHCLPGQSCAGKGRHYGPVPARSLERPRARQEPERSRPVRPREAPGPCRSASEPRQPLQTGRGPDDMSDTLVRFHKCDDLPDLLRDCFACRAWSYRLQRQGGLRRMLLSPGSRPQHRRVGHRLKPIGGTAKMAVVCCCKGVCPHTGAWPSDYGTTGCSTEVGFASCCWCIAPASCKGLLPAQFRTTGCSAMVGSVPHCSRLQQLPGSHQLMQQSR